MALPSAVLGRSSPTAPPKPESFFNSTLRTRFLHELDKVCNIGSTIKAIPKKESIQQIIKWVIFKTAKLHFPIELCKIAFQLEYQGKESEGI
jgi:hypothetical protein